MFLKSYKKTIIFVLIAAVICSFTLFFACGSQSNDANAGGNSEVGTETGSETGDLYDPAKEGDKQTLSVTPVLNLELGEEETLKVKKSNISTDIYFRSSDESVATVSEDGNVVARNVGKAVITVYGGSLTSVCNVTVFQTSVAPVLNLDSTEAVIALGSEQIICVQSATWKGKTININSFVWTEKEGADNVIEVKANENGSAITISAKSVGETELTVSCTYLNNSGVSSVKVKVVDSETIIDVEGFDYVGDGRYSAVGYMAAYDLLGYDYRTETPFSVSVYRNGKKQEVEPSVSVKDETVAKVENGVIKGLKEGKTEITLQYNGITKTIEYSCERPKVTLKSQTENVIDCYASRKLKVASAESIVGTINGVYFKNENNENFVAVGSYIGGEITINSSVKSSDIGEGTFRLASENIDYLFEGSLYTMIIDSADKLNKMAEVSKNQNSSADIFEGYFVLDADIFLSESFGFNEIATGIIANGFNGFIGVFDGKSHKIDGLHVENGGMFAATGSGCVIKNVVFTNASVTDSGFISSSGVGSIKNVYVDYARITVTEDCAGNVGTFFVNGVTAGKDGKASVSNCVIIADNAFYDSYDKAYEKLFLIGGTSGSERVYGEIVLIFKSSVKNKIPTYYNGRAYNNMNDGFIKAVSATEAGEKLTTFAKKWDNEFWTLDKEFCPVPKSL